MDSVETHAGAPIREIREESSDTRSFVLDHSLRADPGQFVMLWVPRLDEKPFCIAEADPLTITVRRVGPLTRELFGLERGDRVRFRGPFGKGFVLRGERILLVGGGYGAAPLGFLCHRARLAGVEAVLAVGARTSGDLLLTDSAKAFAAEVRVATEDGSRGYRGLVTELAREILRLGRYDVLYGCGPNAMLDAVAALAREAGLDAELSYERYMRCGVGICGSCEKDGRLLCVDGPVERQRAGGRAAGPAGELPAGPASR